MARMIPEIEVGRYPHGEELLYRWLKVLPDDYRVFHGVHLLRQSSGSLRRGEADFVVLHKDLGFLVIEVKGGKVTCQPGRGRWTSTDYRGEEHPIKDPFLQAERNVNAIVERIRDSGVFGPGPLKTLPVTVGYCVAFPDGVAQQKNLPLHVVPEVVIDSRDATRMTARVEGLFGAWRKKRPGSRGFTPGEFNDLCNKVLLTRFSVTVPLSVRFGREKERFESLTDEQCRILETVSGGKRALFRGYAGTGKTQLLMENARRFAADGARVLVVCYNQPLAELLSQWAANVCGAGGVTVRHFHGLAEEYASEAGLDFDVPPEDEPDALQAFYERGSPALLEAALAEVPGRFDCVLVDEGQDFHLEWLRVLSELLDPAGMDVFHIFYDEQQNVYGKELEFPFEAVPYDLSYQIRSTANVCEVARKAGSVDIRCFPDWVKGAPVKYFPYREPSEQVALIEKVVRELLDKGIDPSQVMVISSHRRARSCLAGVNRLQGYPLVEYRPPGEEDTIAFSSLHRAKGLESDVVIFCDVDGGEPYCSRSNQYVAVSRARHLLYIIHRKDWKL
ncbi:MAG: NERD domain-containing protein [Actinomycetota bacterium]